MTLSGRHFESIDEIMAEIYKQKTSSERLQIAFGLWRLTRTMLYNCLRSMHPEWDEDKIRREVARRISHGAV
jgi:hypothetical protein